MLKPKPKLLTFWAFVCKDTSNEITYLTGYKTKRAALRDREIMQKQLGCPCSQIVKVRVPAPEVGK